jgi:prepilin-type N-terminal cleavage/methylation domain-containing protein
MNMFKTTKGFTLIELLVVISVISLLSSVILASLNSARNKGKDAVVRESLIQYRNLLLLEFSDKGAYTDLTSGSGAWWGDTSGCTAINSGGAYYSTSPSTYAAQAQQICASILSTNGASSPQGSGPHTYSFFIGRPASTATDATTFSIMAWLPSKGTYVCMNQAGVVSDSAGSAPPYTSAGCLNAP